jgi:hypothetical protein
MYLQVLCTGEDGVSEEGAQQKAEGEVGPEHLGERVRMEGEEAMPAE